VLKAKILQIIKHIDTRFKFSLYNRCKRIAQTWVNFLNVLRRKLAPVYFKLFCISDSSQSLKLHLGCGERKIDGYINIDWRKTEATSLVCDVRNLPFREDSVSIIECYHLIEHLPRHDFQKALNNWYKILKDGGKLVIECPDFDQAVYEYLQGNYERINNIFGLQRFRGDTHLFGYNFSRLKKLLEDKRFNNIQKKNPTDYHKEEEPCIRVECIK